MTASTKFLTPGGGGVILQPESSIAADVTVNVPVSGVNGGTLVSTDASGNVGIGTSSLGYTAAGRTVVQINGTSSSLLGFAYGGTNGGYLFASATDTVLWSEGTRNLHLGTASAGPIIFVTNNIERARIDSSGRICIADPNVNFGRLNISNAYGTLSSNIMVWLNTNTTASRYLSFEFNGNGGSGSISPNGTSAVSYNTTSDYRLKEDVQPMQGALARVAALKPCTYKWRVDGSHGEGFIAHELQEVCPVAVTGQKDAVDADGKPQYQGVDTSFLVATLTAAIKEQQAMIQTLQAEVADLKSKVQA